MNQAAPLTRRSALAHRAPLSAPSGVAAMRERPFEGKLILRGAPGVVGDAVAGVLGTALPVDVLETANGTRGVTQWLGPDEWLIVTAPGTEAGLADELAKALTGKHTQVVDVSDYYTTIELSGVRAREMLMKIATVDLHPRVFKTGMGVTTNFGRTTAFARQIRDDAFDLVVRLSMADYLWRLLAEAGREWGMQRQTPKGGDVRLHLPHFEAATASVTDSAAPVLEVT